MKEKIFIILFFVFFSLPRLFSQQYDKYIWETYQSVNVSTSADKMINRLREEINKILSAGHLAPLRYNSTDIKVTGLYFYNEPGRIITTLAMAYPYLTSLQQDAVRTYVNNELSHDQWAPWSLNVQTLHPTDGARREYYTMVGMKATQMWDPDSGIWVTTGAWQWDYWWAMDGNKRPRIHTLYGLWLYAYNSGDWSVIQKNWANIKNFYNSKSSQGDIYGTMSAHIAMARMAFRMADTDMMNTAVSNANTNFALSYNDVTANREKYYQLVGYNYGGGSGRNSIHDAFHLLNLVPEVGRYLNENSTLRSSVISTNNSGKSKFPLWWLYRAKYFTVWCGEEGVGVPPELIGMIFPVERWVVGADRQTLDSYKMMYAMCGIGDCYVLEALVHTISKHGTDTWVDIRSNPFLTVNPSSLDFGEIAIGKNKTLKLTITNSGGGTLTGTITSDKEWIKLDKTEITENLTEVNVTVDNGILKMKEGEFKGTININTNGGNLSIEVVVKATCVLAMPNPYNPEKGKLTFSGTGIVPGKTKIVIRTLSGEIIWESDDSQDNGKTEIHWDGKDKNRKPVVPGIYIYTYTSPLEKGTGKFTVSR